MTDRLLGIVVGYGLAFAVIAVVALQLLKYQKR